MENQTNKSDTLGQLQISTGGGYIYLWRYVIVDGKQTEIRQHIATISKDKISWEEAENIANRIVECVNALEQVEHPSTFLAYHKNVVSALNAVSVEYITANKNIPIIVTDPSSELRVYPTLKPTNNLNQNQ